ncbi:hypothetical protein [Halomonas lysinitropha]|uniref:Uncharacterized protein n=1 Tax=Halomonas lysinitropha TaxID=2607506 RepID=A0A5K1IBZ3_9GAMM|nr:hypothetical protein [Halomonas lysinitropha]VVZ96459.1 hypothetical protein HALO32_02559 [Halomonas lysinitropha]
MTLFTYCPDCWPADMVDYVDGHCAICGAVLTTTTDPEKHISLLEEQRDCLADCLHDAMQWLEHAGVKTVPRRPALGLIHVRRQP